MWLLDVQTFRLLHFEDEKLAKLSRYAIVSHTWGDDEATFQEVRNHSFLADLKRWKKPKAGHAKVIGACEQAIRDNIGYIWIDTCCINKESSAELSEAINSMYRWYENARICYAYLSDLPAGALLNANNIHHSRWFSRGWTLQELIAPRKVLFFDRDWGVIGHKKALAPLIVAEKGIDEEILIDASLRRNVSIAKRFSWAAKRQTTRIEDEAYSLLGLFDVNMPMLYGEGKNAFRRLQEEIIRQSTDHSIFAWQPRALCDLSFHGLLLAPRVQDFANCHTLSWTADLDADEAFELSNTGLRATLRIRESTEGAVAILNCQDRPSERSIALVMKKHGTTRGTGRIVCELVRQEDQHITRAPESKDEESFVWKELIILREPVHARFGVQFACDKGLEIVESLPQLERPHSGLPFTYLHSSFTGNVSIWCTPAVSTTLPQIASDESFTATLSFGQFLRQDRCFTTFRMVFTEARALDSDPYNAVDPHNKLLVSAPSLTAVSAPLRHTDVEVSYLKATASLASGSPSVNMFDDEGAISSLDPVWTIHISWVRGGAQIKEGATTKPMTLFRQILSEWGYG